MRCRVSKESCARCACYKPAPDTTKTSGWRFDKDGTKLWVASVPAEASRNIYTVTQSGVMTPFNSSNAATLATYMNLTDAEALRVINYVRAQPLGAFVGSTPAFMDPPSIDPAPDVDYPAFMAANKNRRTLIWIGGNDGMMHALDARTGVEVFAFIPFNLLPKLRALLDGQAVGNFDFFVDSSPKLADVRVSSSVATCPASLSTCWRTYLFFGQGPGGTFYQALDVTLDDMAVSVSPTGALSERAGVFGRHGPGQVPMVVPELSGLRLHARAVWRHQGERLGGREERRGNVVGSGGRANLERERQVRADDGLGLFPQVQTGRRESRWCGCRDNVLHAEHR